MDETTSVSTNHDPKATAQESADVKAWFKRIEQARKFDEKAREEYARNRRMARGDSMAEVDANILATYIDITEAFLYARTPDVDVLPAKASEPPDQEDIREAIDQEIPPEQQQALIGAATSVMGDPMLAQQAAGALREEEVQKRLQDAKARYRKRQRNAKAYAETAELVISRLWGDARLKHRGRRFVRSALTIGLGVLKATWQERTGPDPEMVSQVNDLQDNIKKLEALRQRMMDEAGAADPQHDADMAEYERNLAAVEGQVERVIARGFVVDAEAGENIQVAPGVEMARYLDAPWIAHRIPMRKEDAQAEFNLSAEDIQRATCYSARKPEARKNESALQAMDITDKDADAYLLSGSGGGDANAEQWVMPWEIWNRDGNVVLTGIEGLEKWVKPAFNPCATTRFYPFFFLLMSEIDGERHPQSLVTRSAKLVDEYNRIGSAEARHRRRILPKTVFNEGQLSAEDAAKIADGGTQEMIGVRPTDPNADVGSMVQTLVYAQLDPSLYSRDRIIAELERQWGIQEALSGAVSVAKTATEAEIQQTGFQARSGGRRDALEDVLGELAQYTLEVARCYVDVDDVQAICGPDAFWPEYEGGEDLRRLLNVEIRAGSSGKPNTTAERQAWATQLPLLQQAIVQIGQLRQATPADIADNLEELLRITAERSGDRLDVDSLVPQASAQPLMLPGPVGAPAGPGGPAGPMPPTEAPPSGDPSADPLTL